MKDVDEKKKKRTFITKEALNKLLLAFKKDPFPSAKRRSLLAKKINIPLRSVQIWFQNQRQKIKLSYKNHLENLNENKKIPDNMLFQALTELACMELDKNSINTSLNSSQEKKQNLHHK